MKKVSEQDYAGEVVLVTLDLFSRRTAHVVPNPAPSSQPGLKMEAVVILSAKGQDECYLWRGLWKHLLATHPQVAGEKTTEAIGLAEFRVDS